MIGLMLDVPEARYLLATDAGYGFVVKLEDLLGKNKAGKAVLSVPQGCNVLPPQPIPAGDTLRVAVVSTEGRLLVFALTDLPEMAKGKGNKMIAIPGQRATNREDSCAIWYCCRKARRWWCTPASASRRSRRPISTTMPASAGGAAASWRGASRRSTGSRSKAERAARRHPVKTTSTDKHAARCCRPRY